MQQCCWLVSNINDTVLADCIIIPICNKEHMVCLLVTTVSQAKWLNRSTCLWRQTFYRAMLCIRGTSHGPVSVRLSVCQSVRPSATSRCSTKTAKRRITQTTPHDTSKTLVFWCQRSPRNSTGATPYGGLNAGGVGQNRRLSTNSRLYLENGKR